MSDIMEEEVRIKEEPLDEDENISMGGIQQLQDFETKHFFQTAIKFEKDDEVEENYDDIVDEDEDDEDDPGKLQIIDEQADVITVQASNCRRERSTPLNSQDTLMQRTCNKCEVSFDKEEDYQRHLSSAGSLCATMQIYPCTKFCGCYFKTIAERMVHEAEEHKTIQEHAVEPIVKPNIVRYKLKSQYLKRPTPTKEEEINAETTENSNNAENIELQLAKRIKDEPTTPPPSPTPMDKDDSAELYDSVLIKNEPEDYMYPEVNIKSEPMDFMDDNMDSSVPNNNDNKNIIDSYIDASIIKEEIMENDFNREIKVENDRCFLKDIVPGMPMQLPPNLKVIPLPMTASQSFVNMTVNNQSANTPNTTNNTNIKNNNNNNNNSCTVKNGLFTLPKNVKIVKLSGQQNFMKFSQTTATNINTATAMPSLTIIPRNISNQLQLNNQNNNNNDNNINNNNCHNNINTSNIPAIIVKLENMLPKNTKLIPLTKVVLKPTNTNINNISTNNVKPLNNFNVNNITVKEEIFTTSSTMTTTTPTNTLSARKIQVETKEKLRRIEAEPQKRQLIIDMLQQIKQAEESSGITSSLLDNSCSEFSQINIVGTGSNLKLHINYNLNKKPQPQKTVPPFQQEQQQEEQEHQQSADNTNSNLPAIKEEPPSETDLVKPGKANGTEDEEPSSLFVPLNARADRVMLKQAKQNANYRYCLMCPLCPFYFETKPSLRKHIIMAHNIPKEEWQELIVEMKPFRCNTAPDNSDESQLDACKRKKKIYDCERCGRVFSSTSMLNDHLRANCSRDPQYACPNCSKRFYSQSTLTCHLTIHTGVLPHKCSYCDKRFRTRGQVTVHHRTHTGERPFVCKICSQAFTHRETLIAHLSRHIGMKRYKCYGCNKHFSCISGLKTHRDKRPDTCAKVKFCSRAVGPRVRVIRGNVLFEPQPEINPYLRTDDPPEVLSEIQNQS